MAYDDVEGPDEVEVHRGDEDYIEHLPEGEHAHREESEDDIPGEPESEEDRLAREENLYVQGETDKPPEALSEEDKERAYVARKKREQREFAKSKEHALASERLKLVYQHNFGGHKRRAIPIATELRRPPETPDHLAEGIVHPGGAKQLQEEIDKIEKHQKDLRSEKSEIDRKVRNIQNPQGIHKSHIISEAARQDISTDKYIEKQKKALVSKRQEIVVALSRSSRDIEHKKTQQQRIYNVFGNKGQPIKVPGTTEYSVANPTGVGSKPTVSGEVPGHEIPNDKERARDIRRHSELEKKVLANKVTQEEYNEYSHLNKKIEAYRSIIPAGPDAKTVEDKENDRIKGELNAIKPKGVTVGAPKKETIEDTYGKYGQEILHEDRKKLREERKKFAEKPHVDEEEGWQEEPYPLHGWTATTKFNKDQYKRKYGALRTGELSMGWGETGKEGFPMGIPAEKAKFTVGPNKEWELKTKDWEPVQEKADTEKIQELEPKVKDKNFSRLPIPEQLRLQQELAAAYNPANMGQDKFEVQLARPGHRRITKRPDNKGNYYVTGKNLSEVLADSGFSGINFKPGKTKNSYVLVTDEGKHLNPDQIAGLQEVLHAHYGIKSFKPTKTIGFTRRKVKRPVGFSKYPKGVKEEDIVLSKQKNLYSSRLGAKFGERHPVTGELLPEESDTLGVKVGPFAAQRHFTEKTDAIGWGTSWRPGEKEISDLFMAMPRARKNQELADAYSTMYPKGEEGKPGDDTKMKAYLSKYYANDETEAEKEQRKNTIKKEGAALVSAGFGSAYYSVKKGLVPRSANYTYAQLRRIKPLNEPLGRLKNKQGTLMKDAYFGYRLPLAGKIERAKIRIARPLSSLRWNPELKAGKGDWEADPTTPGIMSHKVEHYNEETGEWETRKLLNVPRLRYRVRPIPDETYQIRQYERRLEHLKTIASSRHNVRDILSGKTKTTGLKKWLASKQAKTMLWDVHNFSTDQWKESLQDLHASMLKQLKGKEFQIKNETYKLEELPELKAYLNKADIEIQKMLRDASKHPESYSRDSLKHLVENYAVQHPSRLPKRVGTIGKATVFTGAAVGAGVLGVDAYQNYRHNKGDQINHPILKAIVPKRIVVPKLSLKRTKSYTVPQNAFTDALDFQGESIPIAGRLSIRKHEKLRIREPKDISGQGYKENLPLLGGLGLRAPAPVKGSIKKTILHKSADSGIGPTKNIYVKGNKVPINVSFGRKERWDNKQHRLRAKYNPYKLSSDDREHLVQLATSRTDNDKDVSSYTLNKEGRRIQEFYAGDDRLMEMLSDRNEIERINKKNMYWLQGGKDKSHIENIEDIKGRRGVGQPGRGQLFEDATAGSRADRRARKEQRETSKRVGP